MEPTMRPCSANPARHMGKIQKDKSMVIALLACHSDTCAARTRCNVGAIDTHVDGSVAGSDQAPFCGVASTYDTYPLVGSAD
jgi:hypothetical protein